MNDDPATKSMPPSDGSSIPSPEPASFQLKPGDRVGNYVIREQIGEGGFAIVYAAEQEQPIRRKVALKIIKLGMDTKQVIARFEAERQALAMMDHPNVAKVFDAGSTDVGRPYFVMEYVAGTPINEHCDRQRLNIQERLGLFTQVCEGVQHAHQKGIIHRDIKPSNVLVAVKEGKPQVKVIDFGVAKAISQRLTEKTIYTEQGQLIGTPEYMSPEQAEMTTEDIDTRSDIYSLGVLLYELLTGALPFDPTTLRQAAFAEIQRIIREDEPPRPSTRLSSLGDESAASAKRRRVDPRSLARELRGDLDWIVMKTMEKDRTRRYDTASELSRDIGRYLAGDAVEAAPPSVRYRASRFLRRHKTVFHLTNLIGLGWMLLLVFSLVVPALARTPALDSLAAVISVVGGLLVILIPLGLIALTVLMFCVDRGRFSQLNVVLVAILLAIPVASGYLLVGLGRGPERAAEEYVSEGRYDEAEAAYLDLLEDARRLYPEEHPVTLARQARLAEVYLRQHRFDEAEAVFLKALRRLESEERRRTGDVVESIADLYDAWGKPDKAAEWRAKLSTEQDAVASNPPADEKQDE